ncbi:MAG: FAD:protein FMN transferase [Candidatus Desulfatibia sp.]|uniref:FAD:protein FMN transferase n=1 Tax=Candidatus Desulfatibia sp. TaxID=3101189 RepID=UPI002F347947
MYNLYANSRNIPAIFLTFLVLFLVGCGIQKEVQLSGKTMGTTYHITVVAGYFLDTAGLQTKIDKRLEDINRSMSTYRKDSEISRFNAWERAGEKFIISDDFWQVMIVARKIYELTDGAWDGTVKPLLNLWGFDSTKNKDKIPEQSEIQVQLANVGFNQIVISSDRFLIKRKATVSLDLDSIAKGYGVDQVTALIKNNGIENFLVEIGGEVFASGHRKDGKPWRVGINWPQKDAPYDQIYKVINLHNQAFATSGDYRNYFELNGKRYSHILDPHSGYPISNGVVSVSIVADTCTFADGLSTAVMVLGPQKGLELINRLDNVESLIVTRQQDGALIDHYSKGFIVN